MMRFQCNSVQKSFMVVVVVVGKLSFKKKPEKINLLKIGLLYTQDRQKVLLWLSKTRNTVVEISSLYFVV